MVSKLPLFTYAMTSYEFDCIKSDVKTTNIYSDLCMYVLTYFGKKLKITTN